MHAGAAGTSVEHAIASRESGSDKVNRSRTGREKMEGKGGRGR